MKIKNNQNIAVPEYLNEQFFVDTLEEGLREVQIRIHEINFEWGSNPGDNYCSSIYRVILTYERCTPEAGTIESKLEKSSLIVKSIPITDDTKFLEDAGVFIKEKMSYCDVLPRLEVMLENGDKFGAKYYHSILRPVQTIVFNDLTKDGYRLASREAGLDWHHSVLILQQLAKFHATSMVLAEKDPAIVKRFRTGMLSPEVAAKTDTFEQMFGGLLKHLVKVSASWPGFEKISKKMQKYSENFKAISCTLGQPKSDDRYTVLNHGDMWTNNFMYAYDNAEKPNEPTRAIFVDLQLCFYGSPGCDLNFFLNTSVQLDILRDNRDELIEIYYKTFSKTLEYVRFRHIPTLDDLKFELRSRELYGFFALFGFLPVVTMPKELSEDNSIESLSNEDVKQKKYDAVYAREQLQQLMKFQLRRLDDLGVLDEF